MEQNAKSKKNKDLVRHGYIDAHTKVRVVRDGEGGEGRARLQMLSRPGSV